MADTHEAGAFDIRTVIGVLLGAYGVVFLAWSRLRPVKVPEHVEPVVDDETRPAPRSTPRKR